ncbi:MAG: Trigger factor [Chlamydiae bacterium]|nr:Trigger factor [Chlamydiota bacterium]
MSTKQEEYKNDKIKFVVHKKSKCVIEFEVEVFRPICVEAQKKAAKKVGKEVVVPGFRKGKAPPEIVAKRYPHDLDKLWQEEIAQASHKECSPLANIPIVRQDATITFTMHSHSPEGAKLTLSFETIPEIPSIDPAKCLLNEVKRPDTSKEKVEETVRQTQMFFAKWDEVKDQPIKEGDFIILDIDILEEDPPQRLFSNTRFEVVDKSMSQWMKKLVIGKKSGDVVEGISVPDDSLSEEEKKEYPPKKMRLTIHSIEEMTLPELDDAFAKQIGTASVDDLRKRVETLLNTKADEQVREQQREQVTKFLLSHPFELPDSVIERETKFRLDQMISDPKFKTDWDKSNDNQKKELIDSIKGQAENAVRIFYICRKIAADQSLSVSPKDVPMATTDPVEALLYPGQQHHDPRQPDVKQAEAYSRILLEKTEDWVISHAQIAPKKKEAKAAAPKKEAKKGKTAPKKKAAAPKKAAAGKTAKPKTAAKKSTSKKTATKPKKSS